jgi:hypothetical protein
MPQTVRNRCGHVGLLYIEPIDYFRIPVTKLLRRPITIVASGVNGQLATSSE